MKSKRVSIKNIADELKISISTVSFILNGKAQEMHISKELSQKVLEYAKLIDYKPNHLAQSLRTGKSRNLVFMMEDISNNFFSKVARIFEDMIFTKGYKVIFCSNANDDKKSKELINFFKLNQVDGFIIVPSPGLQNTIEELLKENMPVVLLDRFFEELKCSSIVVDNHRAALEATLHLVKNQFKNIGFITTTSEQTQMIDRLSGYEKAIIESGLQPNVLRVPYDGIFDGSAKKLIKKFLEHPGNLDAVFFATNYLAQSGLEVFDNGWRNKLGIIAYDDNEMFKISDISITAVSQPVYEICVKLMEIIFDLLDNNNPDHKDQRLVLKTKLIIRESSMTK
jgi:LacI family transcriptional regulator